MIILSQHHVPDSVSNIRLVDYSLKIFSEIPSKSGIKKAIKRGEILLNGEKTEQSAWVKHNDTITLVDLQNNPPKVYELKLEIVFEDDYLAVINKPAGISVSGNKYKTIVNALSYNLKPSTTADALKWPLPVHRLDYPTSGLLLVAKTKLARIELGNQFENRQVKKNYRAIVVGQPPDEGVIDNQIENQEAITEYKLIKVTPSLKVKQISLVDLFPLTGRTHQLRRHMAEIGHPILGDRKYGNDLPLLKGKGLFLSAIGLEFKHPVSNEECIFQISEPLKFSSLIERENRRWKKYHK